MTKNAKRTIPKGQMPGDDVMKPYYEAVTLAALRGSTNYIGYAADVFLCDNLEAYAAYLRAARANLANAKASLGWLIDCAQRQTNPSAHSASPRD